MSDFEPFEGATAFGGPSDSLGVAGVACVEAEARDDHEDVPVPRPDAEPAPGTGLSVAPEVAGCDGRVEESAGTENVGGAAGAVVAV